jgi:hypothetical protein
MGWDFAHRLRIRFTFRPLLILIAFVAIHLEFIIPALRVAGYQSAWSLVTPLVLASPPLLAALVMIIGRGGPVKNWCVSFLNLVFLPALALAYDGAAVRDYAHHGRTPPFLPTLLLNLVVIAQVLAYRARLIPSRCPNCQRRTLIPLMRLFQNEPRSSNTHWCAVCGGKVWKDTEGTWRSERRKTWLDQRAETSSAAVPAPASARRNPGQAPSEAHSSGAAV